MRAREWIAVSAEEIFRMVIAIIMAFALGAGLTYIVLIVREMSTASEYTPTDADTAQRLDRARDHGFRAEAAARVVGDSAIHIVSTTVPVAFPFAPKDNPMRADCDRTDVPDQWIGQTIAPGTVTDIDMPKLAAALGRGFPDAKAWHDTDRRLVIATHPLWQLRVGAVAGSPPKYTYLHVKTTCVPT